jgi:hypothetical protein
MKTKDMILVALLVANLALGAVALGAYASKAESSAVASSTTSRAGDYVMVTGTLTGSRDTVLVIDVVAKRANLYASSAGAGPGGNTWELASSRNLAADFKH